MSFNIGIQYDITDDLQFKSITGYRTYDGNISHDPDQSPLSIQIANSLVGSDQFTQELRLSGRSFSQRLDWTTGVFYFDVENTLRGPVIVDLFGADGDPADPLPPPVPGLRFMQNDSIESTSKSAYLHAIYALTDRWNVFAGYRYTDEEKSYAFDHAGAVGNLPGSDVTVYRLRGGRNRRLLERQGDVRTEGAGGEVHRRTRRRAHRSTLRRNRPTALPGRLAQRR